MGRRTPESRLCTIQLLPLTSQDTQANGLCTNALSNSRTSDSTFTLSVPPPSSTSAQICTAGGGGKLDAEVLPVPFRRQWSVTVLLEPAQGRAAIFRLRPSAVSHEQQLRRCGT